MNWKDLLSNKQTTVLPAAPLDVMQSLFYIWLIKVNDPLIWDEIVKWKLWIQFFAEFPVKTCKFQF